MQIFVIGMHRSGTSMTCRLLNLMGAYFGPEGCQWDPNEENPRGFWERRDFRALNDDLLEASHCNWKDVDQWDLASIPEWNRKKLERRAQQLLFRLEAFRPWVLKEPRFCLTFPVYRQFCELPFVVLVERDPGEVAVSLNQRNGMPAEQAFNLWQQYIRHALEVTQGLPRSLIRHRDLIERPVETTAGLLARLRSAGCTGLRDLSRRELEAFVTPSLYRARAEDLEIPSSVRSLHGDLLEADQE